MSSTTTIPFEKWETTASALADCRMERFAPDGDLRVEQSQQPGDTTWFHGRSRRGQEVLEKAKKYAGSSEPIMIFGECGTGRRQLAQFLCRGHGIDARIVHLACGRLFSRAMHARLSAERMIHVLLEQRRRYPDARWLLEGADEIASPLQPYVANFVDQVLRTPSQNGPPLVSTAHPTLIQKAEQGHYQQELFYQLNVLELQVPPLRERKADIPDLVELFLKQWPTTGHEVRKLTADALGELCQYHWPGNITELRNVIAQVCVLTDESLIDAQQLARCWQPHRRPEASDLAHLSLEDAETRLILQALSRCQGNKTAAAKQLGITARTLHNKMQKYRSLGYLDG